jgi:hypothetical protein
MKTGAGGKREGAGDGWREIYNERIKYWGRRGKRKAISID